MGVCSPVRMIRAILLVDDEADTLGTHGFREDSKQQSEKQQGHIDTHSFFVKKHF